MTSLKKLIAVLAVSLPLAGAAQAPAAPSQPLVTIYGTFNVNLQYTEASDATAGSAADVSGRFAVSSDSSNVGVRGALDVAHGLKAVYQCETSAAIDSAGGTLCGRNSRVGLSGNYGTLFYGNWDTPFKAAAYGTKADDPFGNTDVFGYQSIMSSPGFGVRSALWTGSPTAGFDLRANNSVAYWTPVFSGVSAKVQWGVDEARNAVGRVDPTLLSGVVNFNMGALSVVAAAEYHEDAFGLRTITGANAGTTAAKDMAWRVAAGYELPLGVGALTVSGMLEQLLYDQEDATAGTDLDDYDRLAFQIGAKFRSGSHELRARYNQALEPNCTLADGTDCPSVLTNELGAQQYTVGYAYHLAKTTQVYAYYTQILNDDDARYTLTIGGSPAVASATGAPPAGADPLAVGLGIRHAF